MAFIAFHFHWSGSELMGLDHSERRNWCREISTINQRLDARPSAGTPIEQFKGLE